MQSVEVDVLREEIMSRDILLDLLRKEAIQAAQSLKAATQVFAKLHTFAMTQSVNCVSFNVLDGHSESLTYNAVDIQVSVENVLTIIFVTTCK